MTRSVFNLTTDMEIPLATIDDLCSALCLLSEAMDSEQGVVVLRLAMLAQEQCKAVEAKRCELFRLSHPHREAFDKDGWPGEAANGGGA
ncbi:MAG TPA: hypothetical protein VGX71_13525 [Pseudaminobacter sp.]|nr:hypothetical protein [Pseudaminobacter sp.]